MEQSAVTHLTAVVLRLAGVLTVFMGLVGITWMYMGQLAALAWGVVLVALAKPLARGIARA